jgi:glycogen synthase
VSEPRIAFVSREVYPFGGGGLGNYVTFSAAALASVAEVTIVTSSIHEERYRELDAARDGRLPAGVRFEFAPEPTRPDAAGWYGVHHLWSARAFEALCRLYPDGGPQLIEFPDYLAEGVVAVQAARTVDPRLRNALVCLRLYTSSEMCAVLDGHLARTGEARELRDLERYALRNADRLLWPGGDVLGTYRRFYGHGGLAAASRVSHPIAAPEPPPASSAVEAPLRLLYAGRLERRKGVQNLIRAAVGLPRDDWRLTLVGGDTDTAPLGTSMRAQLELMVADDPRIGILGPLPRDRLLDLIAEAHLCISPSIWECWPNAVLEALAQNRPVLATPTGGHTEMIRTGESGWLARSTAPAALSEAIERVLDGRDELSSLIGSDAPRRTFERLTDPERAREVYLGLCEEGRAARRRRPRHDHEPPLASIVIPYFRLERFVEEAVASACEQSYRRIEVIVVNDGSLRAEDGVLAELEARYPISVATQPNSGLGHARNFGIALSRGRYVLPLDADNALTPGFVERCVEVLEARPELAYVTSWALFVDEEGSPYGAEVGYQPVTNMAAMLDSRNLAGDAVALLRRRIFDRGFAYSPDMTSYEDWLLYRQLGEAGLEGHVIPERLVRYRVRKGSMVREIGLPHSERLLGEMDARSRERELEWTSSSA